MRQQNCVYGYDGYSFHFTEFFSDPRENLGKVSSIQQSVKGLGVQHIEVHIRPTVVEALKSELSLP